MRREPGRPLSKTKLAEAISEIGIIVTVRVPNEQQLLQVVKALIDGGVRAVELAHTNIRSAGSPIQELKESGLLIGIGAVTRSAQAREARVFGKESVELLRVLQEALTNARRHSEARNVELTLRTEGEAVLAEGAGDGRGFDPGSARAGIGLSAMRERIEVLGGK